MFKVLSIVGGIAGAASLSQFPEFSQQYLQRMGGAVDELRLVVTGFDLTAKINGMSREEAYVRLSGDEFRDGVRDNIKDTVNRYERLSKNLEVMRDMNAVQRLTQFHRFSDGELAQATWQDFKPAMPVSVDGAITAGAGFFGGWLGMRLLFSLLKHLLRRMSPI